MQQQRRGDRVKRLAFGSLESLVEAIVLSSQNVGFEISLFQYWMKAQLRERGAGAVFPWGMEVTSFEYRVTVSPSFRRYIMYAS